MVLIASSSNNVAPQEELRHHAGTLPLKRGEIGYVEGPDRWEPPAGGLTAESAPPARHSTDRGTPLTTAPANSDSISTTTHAPSSQQSKKCIWSFLKPQKVTAIGGLRLATLIALASQFIGAGATIAGWVLIIRFIPRQRSTDMMNNTYSTVFIHVVFGVALLGQLLFMERRIFRLRAERYSYFHPGEILPTFRNRGLTDTSLAFAPWNRPPLPTYAAVLRQSNMGTGDVEDHLIATPPPPAYGHTRGSIMLLSGFMPHNIRVQRAVSQMSQTNDRPVSYMSKDEEWEEIQDADRARRLEDTLARLERPASHS